METSAVVLPTSFMEEVTSNSPGAFGNEAMKGRYLIILGFLQVFFKKAFLTKSSLDDDRNEDIRVLC